LEGTRKGFRRILRKTLTSVSMVMGKTFGVLIARQKEKGETEQPKGCKHGRYMYPKKAETKGGFRKGKRFSVRQRTRKRMETDKEGGGGVSQERWGFI